MNGSKRLTGVTAVSLAALLLGGSALTALAEQPSGRWAGQPSVTGQPTAHPGQPGQPSPTAEPNTGPSAMGDRGQAPGQQPTPTPQDQQPGQGRGHDQQDDTTPAVVTGAARPEHGGPHCPATLRSLAAAAAYDWDTHGQFVSCVARDEVNLPGMDVSDAAQSDIGMPDQD